MSRRHAFTRLIPITCAALVVATTGPLVAGCAAGYGGWLMLRPTFAAPIFQRENHRGLSMPTAVGLILEVAGVPAGERRHGEDGAQLRSGAGGVVIEGLGRQQGAQAR